MPLRIVADEDVDYRIIQRIRKFGYDVFSVMEEKRGICDKDVLKEAKTRKALLLTEDSDFGEWVFVHRVKTIGVIFLRYHHSTYQEISDTLIQVLEGYGESLYKKFVVITLKKIRIRELP